MGPQSPDVTSRRTAVLATRRCLTAVPQPTGRISGTSPRHLFPAVTQRNADRYPPPADRDTRSRCTSLLLRPLQDARCTISGRLPSVVNSFTNPYSNSTPLQNETIHLRTMQSESERKELHDAQSIISAVRNRRESLHDRLSRKNSFEEASGGECHLFPHL